MVVVLDNDHLVGRNVDYFTLNKMFSTQYLILLNKCSLQLLHLCLKLYIILIQKIKISYITH